jgi:serine/threonine-protein kinase
MQRPTIKDYHIQRELGRGGMATVYLAHDNKFDTNVAIKVLNKEYVHNDNIRKRFIAEARNMFKMSHPNIIKVTDLIDDGDTVAFVMEHIEGETLKEYLDRKGKLSDEDIKTIFAQILEAVGYVHEQNLVHRDIKPSNFMITPKGQIKLLDFGIAKNTDTQSSDYTQTGTSQNMGTPMYMSPEQIKSTKDVTLQSDIYSLGVVLWQMVMGKKPYDTNTTSTFELQMKIVQDELPSTNKFWDSIIQKATSKDTLNRYNTCFEIKKEFDKPLNKSNFYEQEKTILINSDTNKINKNELLNEDDKTLIERRVIFFDFKIEKIKIEDFKELFSEINLFLNEHNYQIDNKDIIVIFLKYQIHFKINSNFMLKYPNISKELTSWDNKRIQLILSNYDKHIWIDELFVNGIEII